MKLKFWYPSFVWMGVIFFFSTDLFSGAHTHSIVEALLRWLIPSLRQEWVENIHFLFRKFGHVSVYFILSGLYFVGITQTFSPILNWSFRRALFAICLAVIYACTDEWHQSFSLNRTATIVDVVYDTCGAVLTQLTCWQIKAGRSSNLSSPL